MPRGGKRPGAGAPKGNLNALSHGARSPRLLHVALVLALTPGLRETLHALKKSKDKRHQQDFNRLLRLASRAAAADPPLAQTIEKLLLDRMRAVDSEAMKNIPEQTNNQTPSGFTPVLPEGPFEPEP